MFFATRNGTVKKTPLTEFAFRLARGKIAINLDEGDALVGVALTDGERDVLLFASNGKAVRFGEEAVRSMGRTATGVRGIRLAKGEDVVSLIVAERAAGAGAESEDEAADEVVESNDETVLETIRTNRAATSSPPPRTATASALRWPTTRARGAAPRA